MKKTHDYDDAFKTLKTKHKRLFISVINEAFGKDYPLNAKVELLPSESYIFTGTEGSKNIANEEHENDMLLRIESDVYLIVCQSYVDDSMALRMAEYSFLAARDTAVWDQGHADFRMPEFIVIYLKTTPNTPRRTSIFYHFPNGDVVEHSAENVFLNEITKEEIIEKKLFAYIPFYIIRYERELTSEKDYEKAIKDLEYLRDEVVRLREADQLSDNEINDIIQCSNIVIRHMTDGNEIEEEVTSVMGGHVFELSSEKIIRETTEQVTKQVTEQVTKQVTNQLQPKIDELQAIVADKDAEITKLKETIEELSAE